MKKVITICLLVVTLLVGGLTVEAKTTKKKSKIKSSKTTSNSYNNPFTKKYKGYIGPYSVIVTLTFYDYEFDRTYVGNSDNWKVKGSYVYTEAGNKLNLKGDFASLITPSLILNEYTPSGKMSAEWYLESDLDASDDPWFGCFRGKFKNLSNGQIYNVYLRALN